MRTSFLLTLRWWSTAAFTARSQNRRDAVEAFQRAWAGQLYTSGAGRERGKRGARGERTGGREQRVRGWAGGDIRAGNIHRSRVGAQAAGGLGFWIFIRGGTITVFLLKGLRYHCNTHGHTHTHTCIKAWTWVRDLVLVLQVTHKQIVPFFPSRF